MIDENLKYVNENQLCSVMNNTKWGELADSMTSNREFEPKVRLKYLLDNEPMPGFSLIEWEWLKSGESSSIEWLEIDPIKKENRGQYAAKIETDYSEFVEGELNKHNIPFTREKNKYRVWGYIWPNEQPNFV